MNARPVASSTCTVDVIVFTSAETGPTVLSRRLILSTDTPAFCANAAYSIRAIAQSLEVAPSHHRVVPIADPLNI